MLACWGHVLSMPMPMPACTGGQTCRRAGGPANERLSGCNQMVGVEGPERVEVEQSTLSGRELSADWRSGPAGEHLVCREVGTGCQSPCKAAFLITSTGVLQRLRQQGCPGSLISLGRPAFPYSTQAVIPCQPSTLPRQPATLPATLPYQSTGPFFASLIDRSLRSLAVQSVRPQHSQSINRFINQPLSVCPAPCHDSITRSLLSSSPVVPRSSPALAHPFSRSLPNLGADCLTELIDRHPTSS